MKKTFIFNIEWLDYMQGMPSDDKLLLYESITAYNSGQEVKVEGPMNYIWNRVKKEIDEYNKKYENIIERNKSNGSKGGRPKVESHRKPKKPSGLSGNPKNPYEPKKAERDNDNDKSLSHISNDIGLVDTNIVNKSSISEYINNLLDILREESEKLGIAYDKTKEREFARHILTAKEYGSFAEKIGKTREELAVGVMKASVMINYRKICSGPMLIYQNYAGVYNDTKKKNTKSNSRVAILPGV